METTEFGGVTFNLEPRLPYRGELVQLKVNGEDNGVIAMVYSVGVNQIKALDMRPQFSHRRYRLTHDNVQVEDGNIYKPTYKERIAEYVPIVPSDSNMYTIDDKGFVEYYFNVGT